MLLLSPHTAGSSVVSVRSYLRPRTVLCSLVLLLLSSHRAEAGSSVVSVRVCQSSETLLGFTLRCSSRGLSQVPVGLPVHTVRLLLDRNLLQSLLPNSFLHLHRLETLDLSHNKISTLDPGCFRGLAGSLRFLDLSSNQLSALEPLSLGGLRARTNLSHNPWHCDCSTQKTLPELQLDPLSLNDVICHSSDIPNLGAVGAPVLVLVEDWDLCASVRRQVDLVMLLTMGVWFLALVLFLLFYIHQNQVHARRHLQYIKTMHMKAGPESESESEAEPVQDLTDPSQDQTESIQDRSDSNQDRSDPSQDQTDPDQDRTDPSQDQTNQSQDWTAVNQDWTELNWTNLSPKTQTPQQEPANGNSADPPLSQ